MTLVVKGKKKRKAKKAEVDYRDKAKRIVADTAGVLLAELRTTSSCKVSAKEMSKVASRSASKLREAIDADGAMESEAPDIFSDANDAIASFDAISEDIAAIQESLPGSPVYKESIFKKTVSDGSLRLGNTGFVIPEGMTLVEPRGKSKTMDDARVITDEHLAASEKVKKIIEKHILEEG